MKKTLIALGITSGMLPASVVSNRSFAAAVKPPVDTSQTKLLQQLNQELETIANRLNIPPETPGVIVTGIAPDSPAPPAACARPT